MANESDDKTASVSEKQSSSKSSMLSELEEHGQKLLTQISDHFGTVRDKVANMARSVADTTMAVKDKVTSDQTKDQLSEMVEDVENAGKRVLSDISEGFGKLQTRMAETIEAMRARPKKKKSKKKSGKKKSKSKATVKKKVAKKKSAGKKVTSKKKVTGKKKKGKTASKKKTGKKKRTKKSTAKRR